MGKISVLILITYVFSLQAYGQKVVQPRPGGAGSWRLLGTVNATNRVDHDVIYVVGPNDFFRSLKFKVTGAALNLQKMVVVYESGIPENIEVRSSIPEGGESRVIDLQGGSGKLNSVQFWYDTKGWLRGTANLTLFGIK